MFNGFQITKLVAMGLSYGFESESQFLRTVATNMPEKFLQKNLNVGQSIEMQLKPRPTPWIEGRVIDPNPTEYDKATVTVIQDNTSRMLSQAELTLSDKSFFEDIAEPDIRGGVRFAERKALSSLVSQAHMTDTETIGQNPANSKVWTTIAAKARLMLMPKRNTYGVTNPLAMAALADNESKIFGPSKLRDMAAYEGKITGQFAGVGEMYESVDLPTHTNGNGPVTGATVDGADQSGNTLDIVTGVAAVRTYTKGSVFWFPTDTIGAALDPEEHTELPFPQTYTLTKDCVSDSSGNVTLEFAPPIILTGSLQNMTEAPPAGTAVKFAGAASKKYPISMYYQEDAIQFVGLPLAAPQDPRVAYSVKKYKNVPMASTIFYDGKEGQNYIRYDMMTGICSVYYMHIWMQWGKPLN